MTGKSARTARIVGVLVFMGVGGPPAAFGDGLPAQAASPALPDEQTQPSAAARDPQRVVAESPDGNEALIWTTGLLIGPRHEAVRVFGLALASRDGSIRLSLVDKPVVLWAGFSPDGASVSYTTFDNVICVVELITGSRQCFPGQSLAIAWSPDGKRVAYERSTGPEETNLFLTDLDTGRTEALTHGPGMRSQPCFSPDGRSLLFVSSVTGLASIWSADIESGQEWQLTNRGVAPGPLTGRRPVPVPDGSSSLVWALDGRVAWLGDGELWVLEPAAGTAKAVAQVRGKILRFAEGELVIETEGGANRIRVER